MIDVRDLVVGYGRTPVARLDRLQLVPSRVAVVIGPNGSGKTTLLKTLAGLLPPLGGTLSPVLHRGPGGAVFVHSSAFLFAGSVRKNMLAPPAARERDAREALQALGAEHLWHHDVAKLSAGQRQRVALARGLAARPQLLLVDEPEGGLDAEAVTGWHRIAGQAIETGHPSIVIAAHQFDGMGGLPADVVRLGPG